MGCLFRNCLCNYYPNLNLNFLSFATYSELIISFVNYESNFNYGFIVNIIMHNSFEFQIEFSL